MHRRDRRAVAVPQDQRGLDDDDRADDARERHELLEVPMQHVEVDVEHHDHEQEQHHHGADVDENQQDREEFGLEQHPDRGRVEEREHEKQRGCHRIARSDHLQRRHGQQQREDIEQYGREFHDYRFIVRPSSGVVSGHARFVCDGSARQLGARAATAGVFVSSGDVVLILPRSRAHQRNLNDKARQPPSPPRFPFRNGRRRQAACPS